MKQYGTIKFSTVDAPKPFTGICEGFTYKKANQATEIQGESDLAAIVIHGAKGELSFSATPPGGTTALGVRAGAEITVTGVTGGKIIVTQSVAKWQRGQPLTFDAQASHYPDLSVAGVGEITLGDIAFSRTVGALQMPADKVWWGVEGIEGPVEGLVQSCSISESVQIQEEEDAEGKITALAVHGYKATAQLEMLTSAQPPEPGTTLDLFGSFLVTSSETKWAKGQMRSISVEGTLLPGITG